MCGNRCPSSIIAPGAVGSCVDGNCASSPPTLLSGLDTVTQIAVDDTYVYWIESAAGKVTKMPVAGGPPVDVATGQAKPLHLAVDASNVYWTNNLGGALMSAPVAGGPPVVFAPATSPEFIAIDADAVYWTDGDWTVWTQQKSAGSPNMIATHSSGVTSLAVSAAYVYATSGNSIYLYPKAGGSTITVPCPNGGGPDACSSIVLGVDGTTAYVTGFFDLIGDAAHDYTFDEALPSMAYDWTEGVQAMAFDATSHYGAVAINDLSTYYVGWRSPSCAGSAQINSSEPRFTIFNARAISLAADSGSWVYWTDGTSIGRTPK
jgi:hypothetical protein